MRGRNGSGQRVPRLSGYGMPVAAAGGLPDGAMTEIRRPSWHDRLALARQSLISASCIRTVSQAVKSGSCQPHCTTKVS